MKPIFMQRILQATKFKAMKTFSVTKPPVRSLASFNNRSARLFTAETKFSRLKNYRNLQTNNEPIREHISIHVTNNRAIGSLQSCDQHVTFVIVIFDIPAHKYLIYDIMALKASSSTTIIVKST